MSGARNNVVPFRKDEPFSEDEQVAEIEHVDDGTVVVRTGWTGQFKALFQEHGYNVEDES